MPHEHINGVPVHRIPATDSVDAHAQAVFAACEAIAYLVNEAPDDLLLLFADAAHLVHYSPEDEAHVRHHLGCCSRKLQDLRASRS